MPISLTIGDLSFHGEMTTEFQAIFTPEACHFIATMSKTFGPARQDLLAQRSIRQAKFDDGALPDFLPETRSIREGDWKIKGIPDDLLDRRVEITGPPVRKMVINALNSGAKVFMADFEDSLAPTWSNIVRGQINLKDAINRKIDFVDQQSGKSYQLNETTAALICRPRGLHLLEKHITLNNQAIPASLIDFTLYFFHNFQQLLDNHSGPYFYIPKLQSHREARWWSQVFSQAEDTFNLPRGTIKATVLIETLPAAFEMDEILYEMKEHIVAQNCGRWDYIFSYIKTLRNHSDRILPDRQLVGMDKPFLDAYSRLLIKTCHKRGALAMGGMAAFIPAKTEQENELVLKKVRNDKIREVKNGHDGTWVAHPGLVNTAMAIFDQHLEEGKKNQLSVLRSQDEDITAKHLLEPAIGNRTEEGMRINIRIAIQYIEAWISGNGCVPIYGLMEDAATAEISRAAIWQWIKHTISLSNGKKVTTELFREMLADEMKNIKLEVGLERYNKGKFDDAVHMMDSITTDNELVEFLTLAGYDFL